MFPTMAWPTQRDAVSDIEAPFWEVSVWANVMRLKSDLGLRAASLARVPVAAFHGSRPRCQFSVIGVTALDLATKPAVMVRSGQVWTRTAYQFRGNLCAHITRQLSAAQWCNTSLNQSRTLRASLQTSRRVLSDLASYFGAVVAGLMALDKSSVLALDDATAGGGSSGNRSDAATSALTEHPSFYHEGVA